MLTATLTIIFSFLILAWGANLFVNGAAAIARLFGVPPLLIGLTIVALGTSAPEMFVAISASWHDSAGLAIGNAIGSNIANIGLVLGISALITPLKVSSETLRREYPILFGIMMLAWVLVADGYLSYIDGIFLILGLLVLMGWLIWQGWNSSQSDPLQEEFTQELQQDITTSHAIVIFCFGLIILPLSSELLVSAAVTIAHHFKISDVVIGLTIIALGTSLPEVATSITSALKGEHDIAIGNVLGSNMFNILAVLPLPGILSPGAVEPSIISRDMPFMFAITLLLFFVAYGFRGAGRISRWEGGLLLLSYAGYMTFLYMTV